MKLLKLITSRLNFKKNLILLIVSLAMFMESVDTTIINTAIPVMARSLKVNPIDLKLALISYLLSLAIFIPISGWVADKWGAKKVFIYAMGIFTLSSLYCGFTTNIYELILARLFQGLGGSLTLPLGRLLIVRSYERHELIAKTSIAVMVAAVGMMLGPVLGGIITHYFSWPWIFWVNIPIGIFTITASYFFFPDLPAYQVQPLDKIGFILFGGALALLTFGLSTFSESEVRLIHSSLFITIAAIFFWLYIQHSKSKAHPIVNIQLLKERTFRTSVFGNLFARIGFGGLPFILPLFLQIPLGYSAESSGWLLAPIALGVLAVKPLSLSVLRWLGYKKLLIINTSLISLVLVLFISINHSSSTFYISFLTFLYGFLISLQYSGMNSIAYARIKPELVSSATSMMSTVQQLSQSFGVAIAAIFIRIFAPGHNLTVHAFHATFVTLGALTLGALFIFVFLKSDDGQELIDKK